MRIAVLELPARFGCPTEQLALARRLLLGEPRADLALLPEAALTGYVSEQLSLPNPFDLRPFAEPRGGTVELALRALAAEVGTALVGPVIESDEGRCFNALVGVSARGEVFLRYRKRHPWYPETWASAGGEPLPRAELAGRTLTAAICFDVHFLEEESADSLEAVELLLFSSAWVDDDGTDARPALLGGLARRWRLWIANANWGPGAPRISGQGGSGFTDPEGARRGDLVATARDGPFEALRFDVVLPPCPGGRGLEARSPL